MKNDQIAAIVRFFITFIGGMLVYAGFISQTQLAALMAKIVDALPAITGFVAAVTPIVSLVWGIIRHTDSGNVKAAAAVPSVQKIEIERPPDGSIPLHELVMDKNQPKVVRAAPQ